MPDESDLTHASRSSAEPAAEDLSREHSGAAITSTHEAAVQGSSALSTVLHPDAKRGRLTRFNTWLTHWRWMRWVDREIATYCDGAKDLDKAVTEASKQTTAVFALYLTVTVYSMLVVDRIQDSDFYGMDAAIKLPVVDLGVGPSAFFLVTPAILLVLWARRWRQHAASPGRSTPR